MHRFKPLVYIWAFPASFFGLAIIPIALMQNGSVRIVGGAIEAYGGIITRLLHVGLPWIGPGAAFTLGHVIWGCNSQCLKRSRNHEHVHVRQYERWGPFFIILYLAASLVAYCRGQDPYRDNLFEHEALNAPSCYHLKSSRV